MNLSQLLTGCLFLFILSSCEKEVVPTAGPLAGNDGALRTGACSEFNYADSTFYLSTRLLDYVVKPAKALTGTYGATPFGLSINSSTGAINVSKSETGLTYTVYYVKTGTTDTCTRAITIAGIDFADALYVLSENDTLAKPTFKGIAPSMIGTSSLSFDVVSGLLNSLSLQSLGLAINPRTANIDLKKTLSNGLLGIKPMNGSSVTVRLYYRVNDASQGALNHIDLRFTYYKTVSDVPVSLMNKIKGTTTPSVAGARSAADGGGNGNNNKCRPPEIVIVG